jgi:hypothetical protein
MTSIVARGIHTGSVETHNAVHNGIAFDLSAVTSDRPIVAAHLRMRNAPAGHVVLSDPAKRVTYGNGQSDSTQEATVSLNGAALRDLHSARGSYFWIDATLAKRAGLRPRGKTHCALDLILAGV